MARRTQTFQLLPWEGGLNSSVDAGMLPQGDLTIADNIVYTTNGAKVKRQGFDYLDALSDPPAITHRASSGTTRTLTFASALRPAGPTIDKLVPGESITITTTASGNEPDYYDGTVTILTVVGSTITYTGTGGSLNEATTATSTLSIARATSTIAIHDYWRTTISNAKEQLLFAATNVPQFFTYDGSGRRTYLTDSGTAYTAAATVINTCVLNDRLIIAVNTIGDKPKKYRPETNAAVQDLGGTPPDFSLMRVHQQRLWTNDKVNKDRLHYSSTANPEEWNGDGDSAYLLVEPGDGDAEGITAIFSPFKGSLFVTKGRKTYQVVGDSPENYQILAVTDGMGAVSHKSVEAVDLDDVVYMSKKGIHSLAATASYGDFSASFVSQKIQPTFDSFNQSRLKYVQSAYIPDLNSIAFGVTASSSESANNDLYLYNILVKQWYRWPDVSCQAVARYIDSTSKTKLLLGTNNGKIISTQNGEYTDFSTSGIGYRIKTGSLYPGGDIASIKAFKKLSFVYKPIGNFTFTVNFKIDNYPVQSLSFGQVSGLDILGTTFVLGSSVLGSSAILSTYTLPVDGYGRGCSIEITQSGTDESIAIYGVIIEYEPADLSQETVETA
jgi:hypothetical protein